MNIDLRFRMRKAFFFLLLIGGTFLNSYVHAQQAKKVNPPFIARTLNSMMLAFNLDAGEAQKLLPKNIKAKSDEKGLVNGGLEIYTTDQVFGMPSYSFAFITLEVINEDGNYGKEGNWAVWGAIDNEVALQNFKHFYNYPYYHEKNIRIEQSGNEFIASVGANGSDGLKLRLTKKAGQSVSAEGVALMFSKSESGNLLSTEIPWLAKGNQADVVSFEINARSNEVLKILQKAKPYYGQISSNAFSYTRPLTK